MRRNEVDFGLNGNMKSAQGEGQLGYTEKKSGILLEFCTFVYTLALSIVSFHIHCFHHLPSSPRVCEVTLTRRDCVIVS